MPRSEFGRCDDRIPIGEREERCIARYEPVGFGNYECRENHVGVSVTGYLNDDAGGVDAIWP